MIIYQGLETGSSRKVFTSSYLATFTTWEIKIKNKRKYIIQLLDVRYFKGNFEYRDIILIYNIMMTAINIEI